MTEHEQEVQRWLRYAHEDLMTAEAMNAAISLPPRQACYHGQQAAEKALKAALIFLRIEFRFRHDLDELRDLLPVGWRVKIEHPELRSLTQWVAEARYPGNWADATKDDANAATQQAHGVYETIHADLIERGFTP